MRFLGEEWVCWYQSTPNIGASIPLVACEQKSFTDQSLAMKRKIRNTCSPEPDPLIVVLVKREMSLGKKFCLM